MLVYRTCTCCRRIYTKLLHSVLHLLAVPCIVLAAAYKLTPTFQPEAAGLQVWKM